MRLAGANERENSIGNGGGKNETVSEECKKSARYYARGVFRRETRRSIFRYLRRASEPVSFPRRRLFPAGLGKRPAENFRDFIDASLAPRHVSTPPFIGYPGAKFNSRS